jgi:mono/diheme cytochrome c family protein
VPPAFSAMQSERRRSVAHGDQMMEYFNCRGCHMIDGRGGDIRDTFAEDDIFKAPPILQQQGWRVQPDWLFGFLQDPSQRLRPWLDIRMPTFPLTDARATTLVSAFSYSANVPYPYVSVRVPKASGKVAEETQAMVNELRCFSCHTTGELAPGQDPSSAAPNLLLARERLRPDWVTAWIKNPQALQEGTRMPSFFTPDSPETVMYPKYFGGSQERQIQALSDYVMGLGSGGEKQQAAAAPPKKAAAPAKKKM